MKIAVIGLGEAGGVYAAALAEGGAEVSAYDLKMETVPERFDGVKNAGVRLAESAEEAVRGAELVIVLTTPEQAVETAKAIKPYLTSGQLYIELNSVPPYVKEEVRRLLEGNDVVDGCIMKASVKAKKAKTPIYLAGEKGQQAADVLTAHGLAATFVDRTFGAACGIKLLRGVFMKSIETTLMETVHAAAVLGIQDSFLAEVRKAFRDNTPFDPMLETMITTAPNHVFRHGQELAHTVDVLETMGMDATMSRAVAAKFFYMDSLGLDAMMNGVIPGSISEVVDRLPIPKKSDT